MPNYAKLASDFEKAARASKMANASPYTAKLPKPKITRNLGVRRPNSGADNSLPWLMGAAGLAGGTRLGFEIGRRSRTPLPEPDTTRTKKRIRPRSSEY